MFMKKVLVFGGICGYGYYGGYIIVVKTPCLSVDGVIYGDLC